MTDADDFRKKVGEESGVHISINSLIIKAAADALEEFPIIAGRRVDRLDRIICPDPKAIRIGLPVQIGDTIRGLIVEKANRKGLIGISRELNEEVRSMKEKGLQSDMGYWDIPILIISNVGTIGSVTSGFGQMGGGITSTLGVGSILERPVVRDDEIVIRKMMNAILLWDHFTMMANTPIEFLNEIKRRLEEPDTYLV
ncbi:MAG: branched-chain alpha-keto acid dehydrogenase subunit E2 [Candidatus Methanolliviera sp. GoM_asphalt]|nr:MAG: branched-chain alpha-keto acid dehydrogenase subunit E2 [Candidatus Methanolliviera sp. GoM_asphalt]